MVVFCFYGPQWHLQRVLMKMCTALLSWYKIFDCLVRFLTIVSWDLRVFCYVAYAQEKKVK